MNVLVVCEGSATVNDSTEHYSATAVLADEERVRSLMPEFLPAFGEANREPYIGCTEHISLANMEGGRRIRCRAPLPASA